MAKRIRFCPRCMNLIRKNDERCSSCGLEVSKMLEEEIKQEEENQKVLEEKKQASNETEKQDETKLQENITAQENGVVVDTASILEQEGKIVEDSSKPKRHKHKPKKNKILDKEELPEYTVDENGEYEINTDDVTYLPETSHQTYSVKKARGDAPAREKIQWWEIYKWADLMLARRKINKEVNKASHKLPYGVTKTGMLIWCILFGWLGIHNFYAQNKKRGWMVVAFDAVIFTVLNVPVLTEIMGVFVGGGLGFVVLAMWINDLVSIVMNHYRYRISKEEFISNLNIETRGKLPKKYWNLDKTVFKAKEQARIDKIIAKKEKRKNRKLRKLEKKKNIQENQNNSQKN